VADITPEQLKVGQSSSSLPGHEPEISSEQLKVGQSSSDHPSAAPAGATDVPADSTGSGESSAIFRRADDLLVAAIAGGATQREAARHAGVSESTVKRRLQDQDFFRRVLEARAEIRCESVGQLTANSKKAIDTLVKAMEAKSESVRIVAAKAILRFQLDMGARAEENAQLAEQLANLKAAMDAAVSGQ